MPLPKTAEHIYFALGCTAKKRDFALEQLFKKFSVEKLRTETAHKLRFQIVTAVSTKMRALWDIALCSLGVDRTFQKCILILSSR
jgi:hypothetical protein